MLWQFSTLCRAGRCILHEAATCRLTLSEGTILPRRQICSRKTVLNGLASARISQTIPRCKTERYFHTTAPRLVHPILLVILRPLTKVVGILVGRGFRKWWKALPKEKRLYFLGRVKENRHKLLGIGGVFLVGVGIYYESHVEETPITKRRRFILFSPEQFETISTEMFKMHIKMFEQSILPTTNAAYVTVTRVTNRLMQANRDLPQIFNKRWSITIIDDPAHNAFILPSGQIFVFTGMLKVCTNDDQLGAVLGHEMAHAVLGHSAELLSETHLLDLAMMIIIAIIWAIMPSDLTSLLGQWISGRAKALLLELPYSRMLETEADQVGLELSAKACFDVRESSAFWGKMDALQASQSEMTIEWLSTHPNHDTRAAFVEELMPKAIERRQKLKCPPLPALDPRNELVNFKKFLEAQEKQKMEKVAVSVPVPHT